MTKAAELAKMGEVLTNSQIGGRRNIVINGAMQISQRALSATNPGGGYNSLDRWRFTQNSSGLGNFTAEQSTDVPSGEGFKSSLKMTNGDAKTITTTMTCYIETKFEGQDVQQLKYGTSSAENVTLSFFVRSSVTGTFCCHLFQEGNNKAHVKEYTISSANTFEKKTLTFTGDTATSLANDNTAELNIGWVLGSGSDAQISADSWASVPSAKGYCTSNQTNWITTNGATFYITGVQLEVGSQATPFEHRSFGEELALCQRYFRLSNDGSQNYQPVGNAVGYGESTAAVTAFWTWEREMRAIPTLAIFDEGNSLGSVFARQDKSYYCDGVALGTGSKNGILINLSTPNDNAGDTSFQDAVPAGIYTSGSNIAWSLDAEL
jgi:hypothetical protein